MHGCYIGARRAGKAGTAGPRIFWQFAEDRRMTRLHHLFLHNTTLCLRPSSSSSATRPAVFVSVPTMPGPASDTHSPSQDGHAEGSDASAPQQPAAKKRRTAGAGTSSRGVANLTPEQLARKRANDREAQRAIRERTKNQIDHLNQRIRELESQQPYHDLQVEIREKNAVIAENADIRKRLEGILSIIQPILHPSSGLNELAAAAERSPLPVPPRHPTDPRILNSTLGEIAAEPHNGIHSLGTAEPRRAWSFAGDGAPNSAQGPSWPLHGPHHRISGAAPPETSFDERMGVDFLLEDNAARRPVDPSLSAPAPPVAICVNGIGQHAPVLPPHSTLPRYVQPTCPLDALLLDFLSERRAHAAAGATSKELVGPLYPNFTVVAFPQRPMESHPLSKLHTDILQTFPDISGLPEKVAIIYIMFLVMRWLVDPTQENYDRMPDWVTPRPSQLFKDHPFWYDYIPWPGMRDIFILGPNIIDFDTFFIPFTTTISLNWPHNPRDVLIPASKAQSIQTSASSPYSSAGSPAGAQPPTSNPSNNLFATGLNPHDDETWVMNPEFEAHLRNINNWSLGSEFRAAFPNAVSGVRLEDKEKR
ncbi:hypothetical protein DM02DRAFT_275035 [Periconia macrospinosa]|uniref:BZIP domain-containing protein n=1 Tax=Periconia macrospinosa TaxID=97972 RepID=A0A2V1DX56_9PLEO|nr:hypothetical protein DM02DRAFT_275035 [Periconia macrospinosa]